MTIQDLGEKLVLSDIKEISMSNIGDFRNEARGAIKPDHKSLEIDLSASEFIDSSGLGALLSLQKLMAAQEATVRIVRPSQKALQILELTRLHRVFEIAQ